MPSIPVRLSEARSSGYTVDVEPGLLGRCGERLKKRFAGRRILVSRETMLLCADAFDFVACGNFKAKGRAQGVELFEPRRKR